MKRENLEKCIWRPKPRERPKISKEEVVDFHRPGIMAELGPSYPIIDDKKWPNGPVYKGLASVRITKERPPRYVMPHIEDHDQIQLGLGEPTQPDSLTVVMTLEDQKFEVKSPFTVYIPKGLKHAEHVVAGSGWLVSLHLAKRCVYYSERFKNCFVEVGKEYEVDIEEASREGQGIARIQDFVIFVPDAKPGDHVKVKVTRISRLAADAEIIK